MVVKMTEELQQKYHALFKEISDKVIAIGGDGSDIASEVNSLPTYYRALDFIAQSGAAANNKKFFRIPLDETPMVINLSTRKINILDSAYKTSIGVMGDANAEIVFFECDRFFDVTDLAACNYILIQWSNDNGSTYHQEYGILQDFTDDKYNEEGELIESAKVLFGWLVGKDVTSKSGKIRFNVRFCATNDRNEIVFDLNTEPVDATILNSLAPIGEEIPTEPDSAQDIVFSRPIYGTIINSMEGATPIIVKNLESGVYHLNNQYPDTDGVFAMTVDATSPDGGQIVYEWYKSGSVVYDGQGDKWDEATYSATEAGSYWVRMGNKTANGTRSLISPTVHIPAAGKITLANQVVPVIAYSPTGEADGNKVPDAWIAKMSVAVNNPDVEKLGYPAQLQYQWYKNITEEEYALLPAEKLNLVITVSKKKYLPIEGANENEYIPEVNAEGFYCCRVINHLNNTASDPVTTSIGEVRAYPQNLSAPIIEYKDKALTCVLQGKVPANLNEVRYNWYEEKTGYITGKNGGDLSVYDLAAYVIKEGTYNFYCKVAHEVYGGTDRAAVSDFDEARSNIIKIQVAKNENGALTYTEV